MTMTNHFEEKWPMVISEEAFQLLFAHMAEGGACCQMLSISPRESGWRNSS